MIGIARAKGVSAYVGDGSNRWSAVHRLDAAHLFRLALEAAPAGARLHAVGDEAVPVRDIADVTGPQVKLPVTAVPCAEAAGHFGWRAPFVSLDNPASSTLTQKQLGWHPVQAALIPDLEEGHYFNDQTSKF
jgi:nucleoside-diphosphate-sugar epimerase